MIHVRDKSAGGCAKLCLSKSWCRSFDYYKAEKGCDLSEVGGANVDGKDVVLKTDYWRNPYDFYDLRKGYGGDMLDLARRANVGASYNAETAVNAVDGVESTVWTSGSTLDSKEDQPGKTPQTLTIDLGEPCLVSSVRVKWAEHASLYYFEFSDLGKDWTIVAPQNLPPDRTVFEREQPGSYVTTPIPDSKNIPSRTRFVRLVVEKSAKTKTSVALASIEVYGHGDLFVAEADRKCKDVRRPGHESFTCAEQKQWGKCHDDEMEGYCEKTCNKCSNKKCHKGRHGITWIGGPAGEVTNVKATSIRNSGNNPQLQVSDGAWHDPV